MEEGDRATQTQDGLAMQLAVSSGAGEATVAIRSHANRPSSDEPQVETASERNCNAGGDGGEGKEIRLSALTGGGGGWWGVRGQ